MKKNIFILAFIFLTFYFISTYIEENIEIPEDAIRIRVLANSNTEYDQNVKNEVKNNVQEYMYNLLKDTKDVKSAERIIDSNLKNIDNQVNITLQKQNYNLPYSINFGLNYFPKKIYKGIEYDEGYYKSLLITLGEGQGDNWWCVLFPPLCLIEAEESTEVEYKSFVKEIIDKYV